MTAGMPFSQKRDVVGECCQSTAVEHTLHLWRWAVTATAITAAGGRHRVDFILLPIVTCATLSFRRLH
jgi:hypothetical protein